MEKKEKNNIIKVEFQNKRKNKLISIAKKIGVALTLLSLNIAGVCSIVNAKTINSAYIYSIGDCGSLLTYKGVPVKVSYVEYTENGVHYPAYCMDKTKPGAETEPYTVSIDEAINDVGLWRRIINGYPYKTIQELGVASKEEAFTATKQAIYCYIHKNNINDYGPIGEAGTRTLNAMKKIIQDAENSTETKISNTITINKDTSKWEQDEIEKGYVSKTYSVTALASIQNYKITLTKENAENLGGIKLTDLNNNEKQEFSPNEKFKILIPIKNLTEEGTINIEVEAKVNTKPVLYGKAPNSSYQDYALTAATYEDGSGNTKDEYNKNETKIIILKKDEEDGKTLQGVEFQLLNENKEPIYTDLKTNEEGKIVINNLVPGTYYIKETKTIDGYEIYDELIEVKVQMNQELTVTINNKKQEKPKIETKEYSYKEVKKLPVTGM